MGRPRKIKSEEEMIKLWEDYREYCNNKMVLTHAFSSKECEFASKELRKSVTYTIEGFCVYIGLARRAFYDNYVNNKRFAHIAARIKEECEVDAREKFELGMIPAQLASLWMGKHGYTAKVENSNDSAMEKIDALIKGITNAAK